jgi:hypothetical protein
MRGFLLAGVCAVALVGPAAAHHPGTGGNTGSAGAIYTISADTLAAGGFAVGLMYEYIKLGGLSDAQLIDAASRHVHAHSIGTIQSPSLALAYGVTDDLMVSLRLPYVKRTDIREGEHEHDEITGIASNSVVARGDSAGIGDIAFLAQYRFYKTQQTSTALLLGFRAPTGRTNVVDQNGELFEAEFQPGSGAFSGLFGLAFSYRFAPAWQFDVSALYTLVGTGVQDTDLGDRFNYNMAVTWRVIGAVPFDPLSGALANARAHDTGPTHKHGRTARTPANHDHDHDHGPERPPWALDLVLELNGEWHDKEVTAGISDPNTGGNTVYLSPGVRLSVNNVSGFVSVGIPVANNLNGLQSSPDYRVVTGISAAF